MGVEACDDCGGQVGDSAETCPHCGSNANHLRRLQPLQEEEAKNQQQEEEAKKKKAQRGCLIVAIAVIALVGGCVALMSGEGSSNGGNSAWDRCVEREILSGTSGWDAGSICYHLKD